MLLDQGRCILGMLFLGALMAGAAGLLAAGAAASRAIGEQALLGARCASRCLSLHITHLRLAFGSLQDDETLTWCSNNRRCSQVLPLVPKAEHKIPFYPWE